MDPFGLLKQDLSRWMSFLLPNQKSHSTDMTYNSNEKVEKYKKKARTVRQNT